MKLFNKALSVFAVLTLFAMPVFADKCKDPIVDELNVLSSADRTQIEKSTSALAQKGADVRVHVVDSFHRNNAGAMNKSLDAYKETMLDKCKSWQAPNGGMKNNLILVIVAPTKKQSLLSNGDEWQRAIEPVRQQIYDSSMNPRFREGKIGEGITKALGDVIDVVSVKPSQAGKPVTINHAADFSGLWTVLGWILLLVFLVSGVAFIIWLIREKDVRRSAQRNAQTERAKCTQSVNAFDMRIAVFDAKIAQAEVSALWKTRLNTLLDSARSAYSSASQSFGALNRGTNNPDTPRLSVEEYTGMEKRYAEVANKFVKADSLLDEVETALRSALRGDAIPTETPTPSKPGPEAGGNAKQSTPPPSTPQGPKTPRSGGRRNLRRDDHGRDNRGHNPTVVVHEKDSGPDFVTGVIVGEILGRNHDHHERDRNNNNRGDPIIVTPDFDTPGKNRREEPSEGGGKSVDWGSSSDGGGKAQSFGETSRGSGASSSWDTPASSGRSGTSY